MDSLSFSPEEYDRLEQRLRELGRLERKYRRAPDDLPAYLEECRQKLSGLSFSELRLTELEREIRQQETQCEKLAGMLTEARQIASRELSERVEKELRDLSMPGAHFRVEILPLKEIGPKGKDDVRFLLAANRGEEAGRLSRIASGGELSRVMLALKNVLSEHDPVESMVFDEIDTGVSGIAAQRVGEKLADLSLSKQVLCVTHLPQIAALADSHFLISKDLSEGRTRTNVGLLDHDGRCREIARLHGGDNITETTLRSAEEQLIYARTYKQAGREKSQED